MTARRWWVAAAVVVVLAVLAGVGTLVVRRVSSTPQERYCAEVEQRRAELTETLSQGTPDVLLQALPILEDLRSDAPADIADEWATVVTALEGLRRALDDAGVDPATYDRDDPPAGLAEQDRAAIDAAATRVGSRQSAAALAGLDQHARDVCGTPLTQ